MQLPVEAAAPPVAVEAAPAEGQASGDLISFDDAPADGASVGEPAAPPAQASCVEAAAGDLLAGGSAPAEQKAAAEALDVAPGQLRPIVVVGPSGVGKGTLIARLMRTHGERFGFTVCARELR